MSLSIEIARNKRLKLYHHHQSIIPKWIQIMKVFHKITFPVMKHFRYISQNSFEIISYLFMIFVFIFILQLSHTKIHHRPPSIFEPIPIKPMPTFPANTQPHSSNSPWNNTQLPGTETRLTRSSTRATTIRIQSNNTTLNTMNCNSSTTGNRRTTTQISCSNTNSPTPTIRSTKSTALRIQTPTAAPNINSRTMILAMDMISSNNRMEFSMGNNGTRTNSMPELRTNHLCQQPLSTPASNIVLRSKSDRKMEEQRHLQIHQHTQPLGTTPSINPTLEDLNRSRANQMWNRHHTRLGQRSNHNNVDHNPHSTNLPRHVDLALPALWPDISSLDLRSSSSFFDTPFDVSRINISSPSMFDSSEDLSSLVYPTEPDVVHIKR